MKQDQIDRMKNQIKEDLKNTTKEELIKVYKTSKTFTTFAAISFAAGSIILAMNSLMFIGLVSLFVSYI